MQGKGIFIWHDGIDEQYIDACFSHLGSLEEGIAVLNGLYIKYLAEECFRLMEQHRKLANAQLGTVLRTHPCVFPQRTVQRREREFLTHEIVFPLQVFFLRLNQAGLSH